MQKGITSDRSTRTIKGKMKRLNEIGFELPRAVNPDEVFEMRCLELIAFKEEFGHCDVPCKYPENKSLGRWCSNTRTTYNRKKKGMKVERHLPQSRIERLEEIGFEWRTHGVYNQWSSNDPYRYNY